MVISDVGNLSKLDHRVRRVVVEAYVKSLEYSHGKIHKFHLGKR